MLKAVCNYLQDSNSILANKVNQNTKGISESELQPKVTEGCRFYRYLD